MSAICGILGDQGDRARQKVSDSLGAMLERGGLPVEIRTDGPLLMGATGDRVNPAPLHERAGDGSRLAAVDGDCGARCDDLLDALVSRRPTIPDILGGYALAAWEGHGRRLVLSRDRNGAKPLYHAEQGGQLAFASELRGLLRLLDAPPEVDPRAVDCFLAFGYVPSPLTMFQGVHQLEPGAVLVRVDGRSDLRSRPAVEPSADLPASFDDRCRLLKELLEASVDRTVAHLPNAGFLLSGGVDTAVLVAAAARNGQPKPRTFTLGFADSESLDERPDARRIAARLGTEHHELEIGPGCIDHLRDVTARTGAPVGNPAALLCNEMFRGLSGQVDHVVTGDGGNEIFGGTYKYNQVITSLADGRASLPARMVKALGQSVWRQVEDTPFDPVFQRLARRYFSSRQAEQQEPVDTEQNRRAAASYVTQVSLWRFRQRAALYTPGFRAELVPFAAESQLMDRFRIPDPESVLQQLVTVRLETFVPEEVMLYVERQAQAHGIGAVYPLLDPQLTNTMCRFPWADVFGRGWRYAMDRALADSYDLRDRFAASHKGFKPPLHGWMRTPRWREVVGEYLSSSRAVERGLFEPGVVDDLVRGLAAGRKYVGRASDGKLQPLVDSVWSLVALEDWFREFD